MAEAGVGEDKVNERGLVGPAGLSGVSKGGSQVLSHTEAGDLPRMCVCASENATEDSVCGAVGCVACALQGFDVLGYGGELLHYLMWGTRLGDTMCRCYVLLSKTCLSGFSHFPVGQG